jgi:large conductance mechanosensitive channel
VLKDFREFIIRGNLVELAVAVVIGTAFAAVVSALASSCTAISSTRSSRS